MKILQTNFDGRADQKGYSFKQLVRKNGWAIYSKTKDSHTSFEVIKVQEHGDYMIAGTKIEAAECMPSSSTWGDFGFSYLTLEQAKSKFSEVTKL